jgi:hypothetical protein
MISAIEGWRTSVAAELPEEEGTVVAVGCALAALSTGAVG